MSTTIRPELSKKNRYWINKHRYYELKHFCLQYDIWKKKYLSLTSPMSTSSIIRFDEFDTGHGDPVCDYVVDKLFYLERMQLIEKTAEYADPVLSPFILKAVTKDLSFNTLKLMYDIPCGKDLYYDRYRKFFWLLNFSRK